WSAQNATGWKGVLLENAISPVQSIAYTSGKNSTDSTIIIDAMDILYSKTVDGFCIVSSDSDFTKLATRLRESGMTVIGMGESKTPKAFIEACNSFKVLNLIANKDEIEKTENSTKGESLQDEKEQANTEKKAITPISEIKNAIKNIIISREGKGGVLEIGELGRLLNNRYSEFDTRNYGYSKLSVMLKDMDFLDLTETKNNRINVKFKGKIKIENINQKIVEILKNSGGNIPLSKLAQLTMTKYPTFSPKDYGYSQFKKMIESIPQISINKQNAKIIKIADKNKSKEDIQKTIIGILNDNNRMMHISQVNQELVKKYPTFTAKEYGYSKFSEVLKDIPRIILKNNNAILSDEENISESKKKIEEDIIKIIEKNGGKIKIGSIKNELKKDNPNFDQKNYGYSKFTKFIESLENIKLIDEDIVLVKNSDIGNINTEKMEEEPDEKIDTISEFSIKNLINAKINDDSNKISNIEKVDIRQIRDCIANILSQNNNVMNIGLIKQNLMKIYPDFNLQDYDCSSFKVFLESMEGFKIIENNANID
ncbi:MAG: NYN domain-containing protein, partial [Lachnospiraceae bacterium]